MLEFEVLLATFNKLILLGNILCSTYKVQTIAVQNVDILKHLITIKKCPKSTAMQFWSSFMTQLDGLLLRTWIIVLVYLYFLLILCKGLKLT